MTHFRTGRLARFNQNHTYPQACTDYDRWQLAGVRRETPVTAALPPRDTAC